MIPEPGAVPVVSMSELILIPVDPSLRGDNKVTQLHRLVIKDPLRATRLPGYRIDATPTTGGSTLARQLGQLG